MLLGGKASISIGQDYKILRGKSKQVRDDGGERKSRLTDVLGVMY